MEACPIVPQPLNPQLLFVGSIFQAPTCVTHWGPIDGSQRSLYIMLNASVNYVKCVYH